MVRNGVAAPWWIRDNRVEPRPRRRCGSATTGPQSLARGSSGVGVRTARPAMTWPRWRQTRISGALLFAGELSRDETSAPFTGRSSLNPRIAPWASSATSAASESVSSSRLILASEASRGSARANARLAGGGNGHFRNDFYPGRHQVGRNASRHFEADIRG